jgi:hypothetical protein
MKFFLCISFLLGLNVSFAEDAATQKEIEKLKAQIKTLQANQAKNKSNSGLKVKDYRNEKMTTSNSGSTGQISPEDQKKLEEALKRGKKYLEERNKYLEELDDE